MLNQQAQVDALVNAYWSEVSQTSARLLAKLDREPDSLSYGSFDREHWGWKFRDFPITMLQGAMYPLARLYSGFDHPENQFYQNPRILQWIEASIENTIRRQHRNGAFDSVGPFTQDHGVSLAIAYALSETLRLLEADVSPTLRSAVKRVVQRSCQFALRSTEDYAFISNHQALFALAYLDAHELLGEDAYRNRAEEIVEQIIREQSTDGWYREYEGADPGYESLGISYLAAYWNRTRSPRLLESLRRSVEFFSHCVHPDGSVGGIYGSRHTSLYFPAGFEMLAPEIPMAASVARFMRERLTCRNVVTPSVVDAENLPSLVSNYLAACLAPDVPEHAKLPELPCEILNGLRRFPDSQITVAGTPNYYAVTSLAKGGVMRAFNKTTTAIAYEDAGYVVRAGHRRWTSQLIGLGRGAEVSSPNEIMCTTQLAEIRQELPTPLKFVLLRLVNLTLFRSLTLGAKLRRLIIRRLITNKLIGPLRLKRSITFGADEIHISDELVLTESIRVDEVTLPRGFMAIHMGSAKYFHPSELETTQIAPAVREMVSDLNHDRAAHLQFSIRFPTLPSIDQAVEFVGCETGFTSNAEVLA